MSSGSQPNPSTTLTKDDIDKVDAWVTHLKALMDPAEARFEALRKVATDSAVIKAAEDSISNIGALGKALDMFMAGLKTYGDPNNIDANGFNAIKTVLRGGTVIVVGGVGVAVLAASLGATPGIAIAGIIGGTYLATTGSDTADETVEFLIDLLKNYGIAEFGDSAKELLLKYEILPGSESSDSVTIADRPQIVHYNALGGNDEITGTSSRDYIYGNGGNDKIFGGGGDDILYGRGTPQSSPVAFENDVDEIHGGDGDDRIYGEEPNSGSAGGDDQLYGDAGNDEIYGGGGADYIEGGADNDRLYGGIGSDRFDGGSGDDIVDGDAGPGGVVSSQLTRDDIDTVSYVDDTGGVTVEVALSTAGPSAVRPVIRANGSGIGNDTLIGIERIELSEGKDTVKISGDATGTFGKVEFSDGDVGSDPEDTIDLSGLSGSGANLSGGDTITFKDMKFSGFEKIVGSSGSDTIDLSGATRKLKVEGGNGADKITTGSGDDTLIGGTGDDTLNGGGGRDILEGEGGFDTLTGGGGADIFKFGGQYGRDTITDAEFDDKIDVEGSILQGGKRKEGTKNYYKDDAANEYIWNGAGDLMIKASGSGGTIVVRNFSNGKAGITLTEEPADKPPNEPVRKSDPPDPTRIRKDPLILDLDGDGVELSAVDRPKVQFDSDGDGILETTGWIKPGDGFLAWDRDGDGRIESLQELFGSQTEDGFQVLSYQDSNGDGVIDRNDAVWSELKVWTDTNVNGITDNGELISIEEAGIESIDLGAAHVSIMSGGNEIIRQGHFTKLDGTVQEAVAVLFTMDTYRTEAIIPDDFVFPSDVLELPELAGFGRLVDLSYAMALSPSLAAAGKELVLEAGNWTSSEFKLAFGSFILDWGKVGDIDPASRGPDVDAQHLAFVEAYYGRSFTDGIEPGSPIDFATASVVNRAFAELENALLLRFASQIAISTLMLSGDFAASASNDFWALSLLYYDPSTGTIEGNLERVLYEIVAAMPDDSSDAMEFLDRTVSPLRSLMIEHFEGATAQTIADIFDVGLVGLDHPGLKQFVVGRLTGTPSDLISGTDGSDLFTPENPFSFRAFDIVGGAGDDTVQLNVKTMYFGKGDGHDTIKDTVAASVANIALIGITPDDIEVSYDEATGHIDLYLKSSPADRITIEGLLNSEGRVRGVTFADGTQWTKADILGRLVANQATSGNDTVVGTDASESGIVGGTGDDRLEGAGGNDTYVIRIGDGRDVVAETASHDTDKIVFEGRASSTLRVVRDGDDAVLSFTDGTDTVRLTGQFFYSYFGYFFGQQRVESLVFEDKTISLHDLRQIYIDQASTSGTDIIRGTEEGEVFAAGAGADILTGGGGDDIYIWKKGDGNDTIDDRASGAGDVLRLEGVSAAEVTVTRTGADALFQIGGETITVVGLFSGNRDATLSRVILQDAIWTPSEVVVRALSDPASFPTLSGTGGDDTIEGTAGNDRIVGGHGNDVLKGAGGSDRYVVGAGDGNDVIDDRGAGGWHEADRLDLGVMAEDVEGTWQGADIQFRVLSTDQTITIKNYADGIERMEFADGTVWDEADIVWHAWRRGTGANDTIRGSDASEVLYGGLGADLLEGGAGGDGYVIRSGHGNDTISDYDNFGGVSGSDTLILDDLLSTQVALLRDGFHETENSSLSGGKKNHLIVANLVTGERITIEQQLSGSNGSPGIEKIQFADGVVWDRATIESRVRFDATSGNDIIRDGEFVARTDVFVGGLGDDLLGSGNGDATYIWRKGDGNDRLEHYTSLSTSGRGTLNLADVLPSEVVLERVSQADASLLIRIVATGEVITDRFHFMSSGFGAYGIDRIVFSDGTIWTSETFQSKMIANGSGASDLLVGAGTDDTVNAGAGDDDVRGGAGNDVLFGEDGNDTLLGGEGDDQVSGGDGNDRVSGGAGDDLLEGGSGDDVLLGGTGTDSLAGGSGSDRYEIRSDDGADVILEGTAFPGVDNDVVRFGADILPGEVEFRRAGDDLLLRIASKSLVVHVKDHFLGDGRGIEGVEFLSDPGAVLSRSEIDLQAESNTATEGDDELVGTAGSDAIYAAGGHDIVDASAGDDLLNGGTGNDRLTGGVGSDRYIYRLGDGSDTIVELASDAGDVDTLAFGVTNIEDLALKRIGDDLEITAKATGEKIVVAGQFVGGGTGIERLTFLDGTVVERRDIDRLDIVNDAPLAVNDGGLTANRHRPQIFTSAELLANDRDANGDPLTIVSVESLGGGTVELRENGTIFFTAYSWTAGEPGRFRYTVSDGRGGLGSATATVTIDETVEPLDLVGTDGNDSLFGAPGNDTLRGGLGDDFLVGAAGSDTYHFAPGDGVDTIQDGGGEADVDVVLFDPGIAPASIAVSRDSQDADSIILTVGQTGSSIKLAGQLASPESAIEEVRFSDGTVWTGEEIRERLLDGASTTGDDVIEGTGFGDAIDAKAGNDIVRAGGGDDLVQGGAGDDVLDGGQGYDEVSYATATSGVDVRLGTGASQSTGGAGNDTITNFEALTGSAFADRLRGDGSDNVLTGLAGSDVYAFHGYFGHDVITDFSSGSDRLEFSESVFASIGAVLTAASQVGNDVLIDAGAYGSVMLKGMALSALTEDRVGLVPSEDKAPDIIKQSSIFNVDAASAVAIPAGAFDLEERPDIASSSSIPHATIRATASGQGREFYRVEVTQAGRAIFDIDQGSFDSVIELLDASGQTLASNDDSYTDPGSLSLNSLIDYNFAEAGTYYLAVGSYGGSGGSLAAGDTYVLNVSLEGAQLNEDPPEIVVQGGTVAENSIGGTIVAVLSVERPLVGAQYGFTLLGTSDLFEIVGNEIRVKAGAVLDHEDRASHDLAVRAIDTAGNAIDRIVDLTVGNVNEAPRPGLESIAAVSAEDADATGSLAPATDPEGDATTFKLVAGSAIHGAVTIDAATGAYTFRPDADFNGSAGFRYVVSDGLLDSSEVSVTIQITPVNDAPIVAGSISLEVDEDMSASGSVRVTDVDGDTLAYTVKSGAGPVLGSVSLAADGEFTYTPAANAHGSDTFTILVSDGHGGTGEQIVVVTVKAINDGPSVAPAASLQTSEDISVTGSVVATDVDGDALSYSVKDGSGPTKGNVTFSPGGSYTYTPVANANGSDAFTVTVSDGRGGTAEQTVSVSIAAVNDAPSTVSSSSLQVVEDTAKAGSVVATDVDGDVLAYAVKAGAGPSKGTITFGTNGAFIYTPIANVNGSDGFTVTVSDGKGGVVEQVVTVAIAAVNDAPQAVADTASAGENEAKVLDLLANDTDVDVGDTRSLVSFSVASVSGVPGGLTSSAAQAAFSIQAGKLHFNPGTQFDPLASGQNATVVIDYLVEDAAGARSTGSLTLTVIGADEASSGGTTGADTLFGSAAADTIRGLAGDDIIWGRDGNDLLYGDAGNDQLNGENGNDLLDGGTGGDAMAGGAGNDIYYVDAASDTVSEAAGAGIDEVRTTLASYTLGANVEYLSYLGAEAFTGVGNSLDNMLTGNGGNDSLTGGAGNDVYYGLAGNDFFFGGAGSDAHNGGDGFDTVDYSAATQSVRVDLLAPGSNTGDAAGDTFMFIEQFGLSAYNDIFVGSAGIDYVYAQGGNDTLNGGGGDDWLSGGAGADQLNGQDGFDTADYTGASAAVTVDRVTAANSLGDAKGDTYASIERFHLSQFNDRFVGSSADEYIYGNGGNDTILAGDGNDWLIGGAGADALTGGNGYDFASYFSAGAAVVIDRVTASNGAGEAAGDTFVTIEAFQLTASYGDRFVGGSGAETVFGGGGNDTLIGNGGNDFLDGEEQNDMLTGGAGADTFAFYERGFGKDTVSDFVSGDIIEFSTSAFSSFADVQAKTTQVGSNAVITLDSDNTVTLQNVLATSLKSTDFHFV